MPTKNQIVQELFVSKNFCSCISKMEPVHLQEDLKMEVIAIVLEWTEERVVRLHELQQLDFFVVRVILNQIQSNTSPFYKKFRTVSETIDARYQDIAWDNGGKKWESKAMSVDDPSLTYENESGLSDLDIRISKEFIEDFCLESIDKLYWYDAEMVRLYLSEGSFGKMSLKTNIPKDSCYWTVRNAFKKLRRIIESEHPEKVKTIIHGKSSK